MTRYEMIKKLMDGEIEEARNKGVRYRKIDGVVKHKSKNISDWFIISECFDDSYEEYKEPDEVDKAMEILVEYCRSQQFCLNCRYLKFRAESEECTILNFKQKIKNL